LRLRQSDAQRGLVHLHHFDVDTLDQSLRRIDQSRRPLRCTDHELSIGSVSAGFVPPIRHSSQAQPPRADRDTAVYDFETAAN
jgi:hypothetical protein